MSDIIYICTVSGVVGHAMHKGRRLTGICPSIKCGDSGEYSRTGAKSCQFQMPLVEKGTNK